MMTALASLLDPMINFLRTAFSPCSRLQSSEEKEVMQRLFPRFAREK